MLKGNTHSVNSECVFFINMCAKKTRRDMLNSTLIRQRYSEGVLNGKVQQEIDDDLISRFEELNELDIPIHIKEGMYEYDEEIELDIPEIPD